MTVEELLLALRDVPKHAVIHINGEVVLGIKVTRGRVKSGHFADYFTTMDNPLKGNVQGLTFTHLEEASDGAVYECDQWYRP